MRRCCCRRKTATSDLRLAVTDCMHITMFALAGYAMRDFEFIARLSLGYDEAAAGLTARMQSAWRPARF